MNITDEEFEALISMKTTIPDTHLNDPAVQPASMKVEGRSMKEPTDKSLPAQVAYARAYSAWLLGEGDHPDALACGISEDMAEVLRRQCRDAQHKKLDAQAPAVSFTEAEARAAAENLRNMAADLCEAGLQFHEKYCRVLARKFDTWRKE